MSTNISTAWRILGAAPRNIVWAWSAWNAERTTLFVTLPQRDFLPDGRTIPLWDASWKEKHGRDEQLRNIREAQATGVPMVGFVVVQKDGSDKITDTFPYRRLTLAIVEDTEQRIVARTVGVIAA